MDAFSLLHPNDQIVAIYGTTPAGTSLCAVDTSTLSLHCAKLCAILSPWKPSSRWNLKAGRMRINDSLT
jgi:hypothetical protein